MTELEIDRRRFLAGAAALSAFAALDVATGCSVTKAVGHAASTVSSHGASHVDPSTATLVLVTMYGGNDGLNTVIPTGDATYHRLRPTLGYSEAASLSIAPGWSLHPSLKHLHALWDRRQLAIVRGVSYPNPSLSHFQSMDIWQTGDPTGQTESGWLGRWLDRLPHDPMRAISIGPTLPMALRGGHSSASAVTAIPIELPGVAPLIDAMPTLAHPSHDDSALGGLVRSTMADLLSVRSDTSKVAASPRSTSTSPSPGSQTAPSNGSGNKAAAGIQRDLAVVAELINADAPTRVFEVSLAPFDTHAAEKDQHERMLAELDSALGSFFAALEPGTRSDGVVVVTYSEFGRRVAENSSGGTDHGTAGVMFVAGNRVAGGRFYGEQPSLDHLDPNGNLIPTTDYRDVYATILSNVLGADPAGIVAGKRHLFDFV